MKPPKMIELTQEQIDELYLRIDNRSLSPDDYDFIKAIIDSFRHLRIAYEDKKTSVKRLLKMMFGPTSEKKKKTINNDDNSMDGDADIDKGQLEKETINQEDPKSQDGSDDDAPSAPKGHGRRSIDEFTAAEVESIPNLKFKLGDPCIYCNGKVYRKKPFRTLHFFAQPPVQAKISEYERYRCNLCGATFLPDIPEEAQGEKYDESAISMIAILKYGFGVPFYRLENLQDCLETPLSSSTQWDKVELGADKIHRVYNQLIIEAAQGEIVHNDDTPVKIIELVKENENPEIDKKRKGMQTTGILSFKEDIKIALFFSGRNHSGENLADLMKKRESGREPPIQMCDALPANLSGYKNVIVANCNSHARRSFVNEVDNYPDECKHVLDVFGELYKNDATTKKLGLSPQERLEYHQKHSEPLMDSFHEWLIKQFEQKRVEPNSGMGQAISYVTGHWEELTRFLHVPGVPLDNNLCEQALKRAILHRKNAMFFKTCHGADVGDIYMSLIHTCVLNKVNPFNYLIELMRHSSEVFACPDQWMPWNYLKTVSQEAA